MRARWLWCVVLTVVLSGCDDDGSPADPRIHWQEVEVAGLLAPAAILGMRASASRTLATGRAGGGPFVLELMDGTWSLADLPGDDARFAFDADFAVDGRAVVVGGAPGGGLAAWAERPAFAEVDLTGSGVLRTLARIDDGSFVASGFGGGSIPLARGGIEGDWTASTVPTPGDPQEKSLERMVAHPTGLFAVGWDDGGEGTAEIPFNFLVHFDGSDWTLVPMPCGGCSQTELRALAVLPSGTLVVGGAHTDWSAPDAADQSVAMLSFYDPATQEWTAIVLPQASALDRVNAIVLAGDGSLVLACGRDGGGALAVLPPGGGGEVEWSSAEATLLAVVEAHDGTLFAGGARENGELLLLRRAAMP